MTNDGAFRLIAVRATDTAQAIIDAQKVRGKDARLMGELLSAAVLYRETMAPRLRVQCIVRGGAGSGTMVADSHPDGWARGLHRRAKDASHIDLEGEGALLHMTRSLPTGANHQGTVGIPEEGTLTAAFMGYMEHSEQTMSMAALSCVVDAGGSVEAAGGYVVQILPEAKDHRGALMIMSERMRDFQNIDERIEKTDAAPEHLLQEIFYGMESTVTETSSLRFGCHCSRERVFGSLSTLARSDLEDLLADEETLSMSCDYCGTEYAVTPEQLRALVATT